MKPTDPSDSRGRRLLRAQADRLPKLGAPEGLPEPYLAAWAEIVAACPDVLRAVDAGVVACAAAQLTITRELLPYGFAARGEVTMCYRALGHLFVPMAARRLLIFGTTVRPSRSRRA